MTTSTSTSASASASTTPRFPEPRIIGTLEYTDDDRWRHAAELELSVRVDHRGRYTQLNIVEPEADAVIYEKLCGSRGFRLDRNEELGDVQHFYLDAVTPMIAGWRVSLADKIYTFPRAALTDPTLPTPLPDGRIRYSARLQNLTRGDDD